MFNRTVNKLLDAPLNFYESLLTASFSNRSKMAPSSAAQCAASTSVCVFFAALITGIVLLCVSFHKISSTEVGLLFNPMTKSLSSKPVGPGLHNGPPGFKFVKVSQRKELRRKVGQEGLWFLFNDSKKMLSARVLV